MPSKIVEADDPNVGKTSTGICGSCRPAAVRRWREELQLVLECEKCAGISLEIDGVCPSCGLRHDDGDPLDRRQVLPIVEEKQPPADAGPDWGVTREFLRGLKLWPAYVVLFIPYALLAAQMGGGR